MSNTTSTKTKILAIVAMNENRVIGSENDIPWKLPEDQKRFAQLTKGHTVLMGRKTYESLPKQFRPLPKRKNVVMTRNPDKHKFEQGVDVATSPKAYIEDLRAGTKTLESNELWIIGGEQIYRETLPYWDEIYLTLVKGKHGGDAFFPEFEKDFEETEREEFKDFYYIHYERK